MDHTHLDSYSNKMKIIMDKISTYPVSAGIFSTSYTPFAEQYAALNNINHYVVIPSPIETNINGFKIKGPHFSETDVRNALNVKYLRDVG